MRELTMEEMMVVDGGFEMDMNDLAEESAKGAIGGAIGLGVKFGPPGAVVGSFTGASYGALNYIKGQAIKSLM